MKHRRQADQAIEVKEIELNNLVEFEPQHRIIARLQPQTPSEAPSGQVIRSLPDSQSEQLEALAIGRQLAQAERRKAIHLRREAQAAKRQARQAQREARAQRRQARIERLRKRELIQPALISGWLAALGKRVRGVRQDLDQDPGRVGQRLERNLGHNIGQNLEQLGHGFDELGHKLDDIGHSLEAGLKDLNRKQIKPARKRLARGSRQLGRQIGPWLPRIGLGLGVIAGGFAIFGAFRLLSKFLGERKAHQDLVGELNGGVPLALSVELGDLTGSWYELARIPHGQEKGAVGCELQISRVDERELAIRYTCELDGFKGPRHESRYKAKLLDDGRIRLYSFPLVYTYTLIEQSEDYLVVGGENRKHLWILARSRSLPAATLDALLTRLTAQGFDPAKVVMVPHLDAKVSPYEVPKRAQSF